MGRRSETERVVSISRTYDTTVEDLFDACTSAERIPRWFLPVTGNLRVGGRYQLAGNAGLGLHVASGSDVDREAVAAWMASDEGRQFMTRSSQAWGEAAVAAGEDPEVARAAAARTAAAYTGT
ncbi:MAG: hypothetical protein ACRD2W_08260 [Acidimicrobiales bacterium]